MAKNKVQTITTAVSQYSGPLPHPDMLARYNDVSPGAAERIISMAESEAKHRHEMEKTALKHNARIAYTSLVFSFLSVIALAILVAFALAKGNITAAVGTAIGAIATVAGVFMYQKAKQQNNS